MKKIGPGIAKIQLKTRAASISACTSKCNYGAVKSVYLSCPHHKWTFLDSLAVPCFKKWPMCAYENFPHPGVA